MHFATARRQDTLLRQDKDDFADNYL